MSSVFLHQYFQHATLDSMEIDGAVVKRLREARFLSQRELAEQAGLSRDTIAKIELGKRPGSYGRTVRLLAAALDVAPADLVRDGGEG